MQQIDLGPTYFHNHNLGGGLNPVEKTSQIGSFPRIGVKNQKHLPSSNPESFH